MWRALFLGLLLGGCTTTLEIPPGGQLSAIVNPSCVLFCDNRLTNIQHPVTVDGAQTVTASPSISIGKGQEHGQGLVIDHVPGAADVSIFNDPPN